MGRTTRRQGASVTTEPEQNDEDIVICASRGYFADDVSARCGTCDAAIVHRPHVPAKSRKLCLVCAAAMIEAQVKAGEEPPTMSVTAETLREVALYTAKPTTRA